MFKKRGQRATARQLKQLIQYMEEHQDFCNGKITDPLKRKELWGDVKDMLNNDYFGAKKSAAQWRKCWTDQKCHVRNKVETYKSRSEFHDINYFSGMERKMLKLLGYSFPEVVKNIMPEEAAEKSVSLDADQSYPKKDNQPQKVKTEIPGEKSMKLISEDFVTAYPVLITEVIGNCDILLNNHDETRNEEKLVELSSKKEDEADYENSFLNSRSNSSSNSSEKSSNCKMVILERMAVAAEKQQAALEILATQSIQQTEILKKILITLQK